MGAWFEDESFWRECLPFVFSDGHVAAGDGEVADLLTLVPNRGPQVLDLCCGPGRHAVELARRGMRVTGVDLSAVLLDRARERATSLGVDVEWVRADARRFVRPGAFDLAINMYTSLGYFDDPADDLRMLRNVRGSLHPGAAVLLEMIGRECLEDGAGTAPALHEADGAHLERRHEVANGRIRHEWTLTRNGRVRTFRFGHRVYSGAELRRLLTDAGFGKVRLYGDLDGSPLAAGAPRLVGVGIKPG